MLRIILTLAAGASLAACATRPPVASEGPPEGRVLPLMNGAGQGVGTVTIVDTTVGPRLRLTVKGLAPGEHGVHLHEVGRCDGPDFKSAGGHWNPGGKQHGHDNPAGAHAGDLPNFMVSSLDVATFDVTVAQPFNDADGTSLVIHAKPDDYRTDPSGNSGDRIACAVLAPPAG